MAFDVELDGHHFTIDADDEFGGRDRGPRPKGLLLSALIGCTAMDVIAILGKMRVTVDSFAVSASGELADEHPKRFVSAVVRYAFTGANLPRNKIERAVELSEQRYCGVRATLAPVMALRHEITINGERIEGNEAVAPQAQA